MRRSPLIAGALCLSAIALAACSPQPPPPSCPQNNQPSRLPPTPWYLQGEPAEIRVVLPSFDPCKDAAELELLDVEAQVQDARARPVEATVELVSSSPPTALVRFTPVTAGRHRVSVSFLPNFGTLYAEAFVARRHLEPALARIPRLCESMFRLPSGALLCDHVLYREGNVVMERCEPCRYALAGDFLWEYSPTGITRFRDTPSGPLTSTAELRESRNWLNSLDVLVATEEALFVLSNGAVERISLRDGTLESKRNLLQLPVSQADAIWVDGDHLYVLLEDPTLPSQVCAYTLDAEGVTPGPCTTLELGRYFGADENGIWFSWTGNDSNGSPLYAWFTVLELQNGQVVEKLRERVPNRYEAYPGAHGNHRGMPLVSVEYTSTFVPAVRDGGLELEYLGEGAPFLYCATSRLVWERTSEGETVVYARPQ